MKDSYGKYIKLVVLIALGGFFLVLPSHRAAVRSASLTSVSDTLSSSKLSFYGLMGAGNTVGSSTITINTTTAPSTSSSQLASPSASTVKIGTGIYTLSSTMPSGDESKFGISTGLASGDQTAGNAIIATQSASHTIRFTTATAVPDGAIRILIQSTFNTGSSNDGIPDGDGFDFKTTAPTVTCPADSAGYDFVTGTATAQAFTLNTTKYHSFECRYSGTGAVSQSFSSNPIIITSLINPAPRTGHTIGTADAYSIIVQNLNGVGSYSVVDQTSINVGAIEAVRVSATVSPQITFKIAGIPSGVAGNNACGSNTSVTTTPLTVPFGAVSISAFTYAAQSLEVSTNAVNGYVVTSQENMPLTIPSTATTIPDATGNSSTMTYSNKATWDSTSAKGFGYSLTNISANTVAFQRTDTDGDCTGGTFCAKNFAALSDSEPSQNIFSSATTADGENVDVCYKIIISNLQGSGDYENQVTYTATSTF